MFADSVNNLLAGGLDRNGQAPALNLFTYDESIGAAYTLAVTAITPDQIAAASAGAPGSNGNAIALAQLASQPTVNGFSFIEFYGALGARLGRDLNSARENRDVQIQLVTQARTLREQASGVSLDEEAAKVIQYQRSYQAASKLVGVLDELTLTLINLIR
jgi:flagellar hook-associated protein 1 FlgK